MPKKQFVSFRNENKTLVWQLVNTANAPLLSCEVVHFWVPENCPTLPCQQIVNPILLCDWSKENDIFDSCQVLSQHESEILNGRDQRLSFFPARRFDQRVANFQIKVISKESLWDQGNRFLSWVIFAFIRFPTGRLSYNYCSFVFKMSLGQHRSVFRLL